jgi:hypothetical protein
LVPPTTSTSPSCSTVSPWGRDPGPPFGLRAKTVRPIFCERSSSERFVEPRFWDLDFDQGLVFSEIDVVEQGWRGYRPCELLSYLLLGLYNLVCAHPLEHPRVETAGGPRYDPGYPHLLQGGRCEDAGLDVVLAYHDGCGVEALDVQTPHGGLVSGIRGDEVNIRQPVRETLYHALSSMASTSCPNESRVQTMELPRRPRPTTNCRLIGRRRGSPVAAPSSAPPRAVPRA